MFSGVTVKHVLETTSGAEGGRVTRQADTPWHFLILNHWVWSAAEMFSASSGASYLEIWAEGRSLEVLTLAQLLTEAKTESCSHTAFVVLSYRELGKSNTSALLQSLHIYSLMKNKNGWTSVVWAKYALLLKYKLSTPLCGVSTSTSQQGLNGRIYQIETQSVIHEVLLLSHTQMIENRLIYLED